MHERIGYGRRSRVCVWRYVRYKRWKLLPNDYTDDVDNNCIDNDNYYSARNVEEYNNWYSKYDTRRKVDYTENVNNSWSKDNHHAGLAENYVDYRNDNSRPVYYNEIHHFAWDDCNNIDNSWTDKYHNRFNINRIKHESIIADNDGRRQLHL